MSLTKKQKEFINAEMERQAQAVEGFAKFLEANPNVFGPDRPDLSQDDLVKTSKKMARKLRKGKFK